MVSERAVFDALLSMTRATGVLVGDGDQPAGSGWVGVPGQSDFVPYAVMHPLSGGFAQGSLADPHADPEWPVQFSCYGASRSQSMWVADVLRPVVLGWRPTSIPGVRIRFVALDMEGGSRRIDTVQPPVWQAVPRYRLFVTPA